MKKKYFAPEMEELEMDEPVVLQDQEASTEVDGACPGEEAAEDDF